VRCILAGMDELVGVLNMRLNAVAMDMQPQPADDDVSADADEED